MNILLSYPSEFDNSEGIHYPRVLRRLGHEVHEVNVAATFRAAGMPTRVVRGYVPDTTIDDLFEEHGKADLYLYIEPWGLVPRGLEASPIPTACIISDTHRNPGARRMLSKLFDHVFVYHRNHAAAYAGREPGTVHWVPYACDTEVVRDLGLPRDIDVGFVGRLYTEERRRVIGTLARRYRTNDQHYYPQQEIPELYSRAKIVVDLPPGDYIPFRVFEALSCGALLITRRMRNGQEELFEEGVHYLAFDSEQELYDKVEFYLRHEDERQKIAARGHDEVRRNHTLAGRVERMLEIVRLGPALGAPARRMSAAEVLGVYAAVYERSGKVETLLRLAATERAKPATYLWLLLIAFKSFLRRVVLGW